MGLSQKSYKEIQDVVRQINNKLRADDYRFSYSVKLIHEEGTVLFFECAFVEEIEHNWIAVFTEHHGTEIYHKSDLLLCIQYDVEKVIDLQNEFD